MNKAELIAAITPLVPAGMTFDAEATNAVLEDILAVLEAPAALVKAQGDLNAANGLLDTANGRVTELEGDVTDLNGELAKHEELRKLSGDKSVIAELGDKKYLVQSGCSLMVDGVHKAFTKEEVAADKGIMERLLDMKSEILKELK